MLSVVSLLASQHPHILKKLLPEKLWGKIMIFSCRVFFKKKSQWQSKEMGAVEKVTDMLAEKSKFLSQPNLLHSDTVPKWMKEES